MPIANSRGLAALVLAATAAASAQDSQPAAVAAYRDFAALSAATQALAGRDGVERRSLGRSWGGRDVWLLTLAAAGDPPAEERPALLLVGGIDADQPVSVEACLGLVERLAGAEPDTPAGALLDRFTVYALPCVNPDGYVACFDTVRNDARVNGRPLDDDRDGLTNEDGPNDLDGDGAIGVMRIPDPAGAWLADAEDPRLLRKARVAEGERGRYRLAPEGVDNDADGAINEDGPGGIDPDRNFPHLFEPGVAAAGVHPISEPESRALAEFVVGRPNIIAAIVLGRHDNLVEPPKGKERGPDGRSYRDLHPDDADLYALVSKAYREISGHKTSPGADPRGALYAWLYNQRGIPTFALRPWWPLDRPAEAEASSSQPTSGPVSETDGGPTEDVDEGPGEADEADEAPRRGRRRAGGRGAGPAARAGGADEDDPADALAAQVSGATATRWWKYLDGLAGGAPAEAWRAATHPQFGDVELGGLPPLLAGMPPAEELAGVVDAQLRLLERFADWLPQVRWQPASTARVGADVWRVELHLANDGLWPTHCAMARHVEEPGFVVGPDLPAERVLGEQPTTRVESVPAASAVKLSWLLRGTAGEEIAFIARQRRYGETRVRITLTDETEDGR